MAVHVVIAVASVVAMGVTVGLVTGAVPSRLLRTAATERSFVPYAG